MAQQYHSDCSMEATTSQQQQPMQDTIFNEKRKGNMYSTRRLTLSRSLSCPKENTKLHGHSKGWKRIEGLNPQENWKKLKLLAQGRLDSYYNDWKNEIKTRDQLGVDDENDTAGLMLSRRLECNQVQATLLAMVFQRDEKGLPRIPVLLSILKVQVYRTKDVMKSDKRLSRKVRQLRLVISYGSTEWTIFRRYWDFVKLHYSYYGYDLARARKPARLPVFPNMILHQPPRQKHLHRHGKHQQHMDQQHMDQQHMDQQIIKPNHLHRSQSLLKQQEKNKRKSANSSTLDNRGSLSITGDQLDTVVDEAAIRQDMVGDNGGQYDEQGLDIPLTTPASPASSLADTDIDTDNHQHQHEGRNFNQHHSENGSISMVNEETSKYDKLLEQYMVQLIGATLHSGNINRLCKFLEISTLGLHLKATQPQGYHGKEGYMVITSRTDREPRHTRRMFGSSCFGIKSTLTAHSQDRNSPKWFIVRENFMVCVNHPRDLDYYDVLLFEPGIQMQRGNPQHSTSKTGKLKIALTSATKLSQSHSTLCIRSSAGEMYLRAKNVRQAIQFEQSILRACRQSTWCLPPQRFNSFAPVRLKCPTTWFVDGDDYFWQVSVALENANKYVYIHDWWLSPELYLRRPHSGNQKWRLDKVLKRKAEQGVKIYIIIYKEVALAMPLFSHHTKQHLLSLSKNIYVQRHPSRALDIFSNQGTLFYAHHEKICLVDGVVAFIGGLDLCYGRYDTGKHTLVDDPATVDEQIWVGKDYANPRIEDFNALDKPFEDNINRSHLPRMPWHDISVRICGEAALDVEHHFVQRWNFLRRRKTTAPKRETAMLLPSTGDLSGALNNNDPRIGSQHSSSNTQVQILRSVSTWSTGVETTEHSIMDAYVELIGASQHYIYIENQFFITSTKCGTTVIENKIGDALYHRIVRAHEQKEDWKAVIMMPLVPEFPGTFDLADGTTIRLIMNSQYLSIGRGPDSLLGRLRDAGIVNTSHYINFYGLRTWGELNGAYVTEQVYIHAKTMVVDDRTVVIGSANINERSMLGGRDSEICACIEDNDLVDSTFGGRPVKVGRFAHSLRLRLMAEHLGLPIEDWSVEKLLNRARPNKETTKERKDMATQLTTHGLVSSNILPDSEEDASSCHSLCAYHLEGPESHHQHQQKQHQEHTLDHKTNQQLKHSMTNEESSKPTPPIDTTTNNKEQTTGDQPDSAIIIPGPDITSTSSTTNAINATTASHSTMRYPMNEEALSLYNTWASWNTDTDNNADEFNLVPIPLPLMVISPDHETGDRIGDSDRSPELTFCDKRLQIGSDVVVDDGDVMDIIENHCDDIDVLFACLGDPLMETTLDLWHTRARCNTDLFRRCFMVMPDNNVRTWTEYGQWGKMARQLLRKSEATDGVVKQMMPMITKQKTDSRLSTTSSPSPSSPSTSTSLGNNNKNNNNNNTTFMLPFVPLLLEKIKGHLVIWPTQFLQDEGDNFIFSMDKLAPLEIFD